MNTISNQALNASQSIGPEGDTVGLTFFLDLIIGNRWLITIVAFVVTFLGSAYAFIATPIYQANILIQVEDSSGSSRNLLGDLSGAFDIKSAATAEMEIIRSRLVVTRAVDNVKLDLNVQPKYFPIFGRWLSRYNDGLSKPGFFGFGGYVWGKERAEIDLFNVPATLAGERFVLIAAPHDQFELKQEDAAIDVVGAVGQTIKITSIYGPVELRVDRLSAQPGAVFFVTRTKKLDTVEELQSSLAISEKGKQSGIIGVSLEGADPEKTSLILNEVGKEYIRQNVERKSEEAEKSLDFLAKQMPKMKESLEQAESKYNALRNSRGTIDLGEEAKSILQQSVLSQTRLLELKQRRDELLSRYQETNPIVTAVNQQIHTLQSEIDSVNRKIRIMPSVEQDVLRLTRDVKVTTELYTSLLNSAQQLRLLKASKVGNARLLDTAIAPLRPVRPKRALIVLMSALIGMMTGVLSAFVRTSLFGGIEDPHEVEQALGLSVTAAIPFSEKQAELYVDVKAKTKKVSVLAQEDPRDSAIESLRSFRTALQFHMLTAANKIVMITGPTPAVGKSFVSVNFAAVLAASGKRVLLIDGDLRKGYLHNYFGIERDGGLSELITRSISVEKAIHYNVVSNVDLIATGALPPSPAELLGHANFSELLAELAAQYDYVLIDTAPVLAVSDGLVVAPIVGAIFTVARSGSTTLGEIDETVKRIHQAGGKVSGVVFNGVRARLGGTGYGGKYGRYRYAEYQY
jgi:tyrosine-protein kinase Etk/Wzc